MILNIVMIAASAAVTGWHFCKLGHSHGCVDTWRIVIAQRCALMAQTGVHMRDIPTEIAEAKAVELAIKRELADMNG
ncbi:hypothetical protein GCM10008023_05800 [Sphingomonas glacialis]|uniref:Uncharacterized protein n=1 Tax=Sphingomonas glacialis TaxID=658225 RepID=A0ABQ3L994_9SPHN|nr:hypothetical protein [Sphingomonas glacialis]GHH09300.1 hypothetical protein GCM10008023_05800 [Sphingomonas glacialis]